MDRLPLNNTTFGASRDVEPRTDGWQHEHLAAQLELDALRLLADAGTPELAKFAIDTVDEQQRDKARDDFAQTLGFVTYSNLLAASAGVATSDDKLWFVTMLSDGHWVGWNYIDMNIRVAVKYATREAAIRHVEQSTANTQV